MMYLVPPARRSRALAALAVAPFLALSMGLGAPAIGAGAVAIAASTASCSDALTSAPTGPATVSATSSGTFGKVLVIGSGGYNGCSLYLLTSDRLHALAGAPFACSDGPNAIGQPCDTVLWPALLTKGAPIAGPRRRPRPFWEP